MGDSGGRRHTTFITIIGTVGTLAGLVLAIYVLRSRRYPGQITYLRDSCIGLFDSVIRNLPELIITYEGNPVGPNLVLLRGYLLNTGRIDIREDMVERRLAIKLPPGFKWFTAKIVSRSPDVRAGIVRTDSAIHFDLGLFRCDEFILFEALAGVPLAQHPAPSTGAAKMLESALGFSHRIANTRRVEKKFVPNLAGTSLASSIVGSILSSILSFVPLILAVGFLGSSSIGGQLVGQILTPDIWWRRYVGVGLIILCIALVGLAAWACFNSLYFNYRSSKLRRILAQADAERFPDQDMSTNASEEPLRPELPSAAAGGPYRAKGAGSKSKNK